MMALPFSGHGVTLGGLELVAWGEGVTHDEGFTTEISADGTTWGNPAVVVSSLISALSDGDIVQQQRAGNREPVLYVRIIGTDHYSLVAGDSALSAVAGGPCELVWQPPDPDAPPTVIDVVHSRMDHAWDDMDALKFERVWTVTMSALPWPRSAERVITPAIATAAPTVVDDGSSTTGWTSDNGTVTTSAGGAVVSTYAGDVKGGGVYGTSLTLTAAVDTSTAKYVAIDWGGSAPGSRDLTVNGGSVPLPEVRREPAPTAGFARSWYYVAADTVTSLRYAVAHAAKAGSQTLAIDQIVKAATLPTSGSAKQVTRTVDPGGNVTAEGTIVIQHASAGLGQTLVYSHPIAGGYSPALRQWKSSGSTDADDPTTVSGKQHALDTVTSFVIPATSIPRGDVHLWVRVNRATTGPASINGGAYSAAAAGAYVGDSQGFTVTRTFTEQAWTLVPVARLTLPTAQIGSAGYVQIDMSAAGLYLDEAWLFAMDAGCLTVLDCGSGTPAIGSVSNRLRIEAPSPTRPFGAIMVGVAADWSDAHTPSAEQVLCDRTGHRFDPDGSMIHVVTAGPTTEATISLEHYPRWRAEAS